MTNSYRGGVIHANNKTALISFNPGWGEPGEWNITFLNEELGKMEGNLTLDAADSFSSQQNYWDSLSYGRERNPEHFENYKWETEVGNYEDAIRIGLEYTGYNDDNLAEDTTAQARMLAAIKQSIDDLSNSCNCLEDFDSIAEQAQELSKFVTRISAEWKSLESCRAVYQAIKDRKQVGCGWTAKTL